MILQKILLICFCLTPALGLSDSYKVGLNFEPDRVNLDRIQMIRETLNSTGIDFEFYRFPAARGLNMVINGHLALDLYRVTGLEVKFPQLIRIEPPVDYQHIWLITGNPQLCQIDQSQLKQHSFVGLLGTDFFGDLKSDFKSYSEVGSLELVALMLSNKRVSYSAWNRVGFEAIKAQTRANIVLCDQQPVLQYPIHSYLHTDNSHLLPLIEAAYRKVFQ